MQKSLYQMASKLLCSLVKKHQRQPQRPGDSCSSSVCRKKEQRSAKTRTEKKAVWSRRCLVGSGKSLKQTHRQTVDVGDVHEKRGDMHRRHTAHTSHAAHTVCRCRPRTRSLGGHTGVAAWPKGGGSGPAYLLPPIQCLGGTLGSAILLFAACLCMSEG